MCRSLSACRRIDERPARRGVRWLRALLPALWLAGCGPAEPLQVVVEEARPVAGERAGGWGNVVAVRVRLENRGDAPVHVFSDLLQLRGENGTRGTVREFRDRYRLDLARAADEQQRRRLRTLLSQAGIDAERVRDVTAQQIEVTPGEIRQLDLPFLLRSDNGDARYAMDFPYHDDATDRVVRLTVPVRSPSAR